jgi:sporulation protein YlmC with PRC-barrel domain
MNEIKALHVANQLIGMPVIVPCSARKLGQVADAVVHPTEGRGLGLVLRSPKDEEWLLRADDIFIFGTSGAVLAEDDLLTGSESLEDSLTSGVRVRRDLIGASVVTDAGGLLGRVHDVYILEERLLTVYRVVGSMLQGIFGGGFFLAGNAPHAWSRSGFRLIVPVSARQHHAASSLAEAIKALEQEPAFTENQS